jgi:hypothetical protein
LREKIETVSWHRKGFRLTGETRNVSYGDSESVMEFSCQAMKFFGPQRRIIQYFDLDVNAKPQDTATFD